MKFGVISLWFGHFGCTLTLRLACFWLCEAFGFLCGCFGLETVGEDLFRVDLGVFAYGFKLVALLGFLALAQKLGFESEAWVSFPKSTKYVYVFVGSGLCVRFRFAVRVVCV